ncbi:MAG: VOC family protein [Beijerinckiaceae bacterium]
MFYPGVSLVTLAVRDVARSRAFYERVGWRGSTSASSSECAFFALNNVALALYDRAAFDAETGAAPSGADRPPNMALAQNHGSPASVDEALRKFVQAGGAVIKPGGATHWGGYTAIVADPDGHIWELAWNPAFPLNADGTIDLPT